MLRLETEFILSDIQFSKYDEKGILGITCDTFETKYVGQLSHYRISATGQIDEIQSVELSTGGVSLAQSSKYDSFIFTAHTDPVLRLWSLKSIQKPIKRYTYHNMSVEGLEVSPFDGEEFISCSKDSSFAIWNIANSEPIFAATNEASFPVLATQYHPQNPSLFVAAPLDARLELWDRQELKRVYTVTPPDDLIFSCMAFNSYNEFMLSVADEYGHVYIWDLRQLKKPVYHFQAHGLSVCQMKFNPHDEKLLGTASTDCHFHLWYVEGNARDTAKNRRISTGNLEDEAAIGMYEDENSMDNVDVQCLKSFKTHNLPITTWDWSVHDLGLLADAGSDYSIFVWNFVNEDLETGES
jgi:WD40 repeat protein